AAGGPGAAATGACAAAGSTTTAAAAQACWLPARQARSGATRATPFRARRGAASALSDLPDFVQPVSNAYGRLHRDALRGKGYGLSGCGGGQTAWVIRG